LETTKQIDFVTLRVDHRLKKVELYSPQTINYLLYFYFNKFQGIIGWNV